MNRDLVIQGSDADQSIADTLATKVGADRAEQVGLNAFRILNPRLTEQIPSYFDNTRIDFALVPATRRLAEFRLVAMDMDSTLITIECIDELADLVGRKTEVAAITAAAMRGELDYPTSLRQRVHALAGIDMAAVESVYLERLRLSPGTEAMLARLHDLRMKTLLVSGGFTYFTDRLRQRLGLDFAHSNTLEIEHDRLTGRLIGDVLDGAGKARVVIETAKRLGVAVDQIIAIGDGANDLPMMAEAGVSIAYHAKPAVQKKATYCFNHVGLDGLLHLFR
ncbi:MAG: phosphoserine phosphatase SerB [Burkholderiales bacterium]